MRLVATHNDVEIAVEVERHGSGYRVKLGDRWLDIDLVHAGPYLRSLRLEDGTQLALAHHREGTMHTVSLGDSSVQVSITDPLSLKRGRREDEVGGSGRLKALMPGRIVRVLVSKGETVRKGQGLLVLEAMKMENEIQAPLDGVVDQILVSSGQTVDIGAELVHITAES